MKRYKEVIRISTIGIIANIILVVLKAIIGFITNSIAISLDAWNNLSDALSSTITIIGTKLSLKKPDKEHPYGHGRIEYFTAVLISFIVLFAGITSMKKSIDKIINPVSARYSFISLMVILIAMFTKLILGDYFKEKGKKLHSNSLYASGVDAIGDFLISFATFITAIVSILFKLNLEGYVGVLISIVILKSGIEILKTSINDVIGIRADSKLTKKLKDKILSYDNVLGVHDLSLHNYGPINIIATAHIDVKETMTAKEIYRLSKVISEDIYSKFNIILTLGIYAYNEDKKYNKIRNYIDKLILEYKSIIEIHGFYVDEELKTLSFDIIFDFNEENSDKIIKELQKKLKEKYPEYECLIIIDKDISD